MLVSVFCVGWFTLLADEFKDLGWQIFAGSAFVSNFANWSDSGYFDRAAEVKPLLHLWSLAIEEQFYIVWPVLLLGICKVRGRYFVVLLLALISFTVNKFELKSDPVGVFYAPWTRSWELLCGAILAMHGPAMGSYLASQPRSTTVTERILRVKAHFDGTLSINVRAFLGAGLILIGLVRISQASNFPGSWALLPTIGAVLIISSSGRAWINRVVLSHPALVWIGLISFPLYLWHWPLLAFARIVFAETPSFLVRIALVVLAIALSWGTYRFVEQPIRSSIRLNRTALLLLAALVFVGAMGGATFFSGGFPSRAVEKVNALHSSGKDGGVVGIPISTCQVVDQAGKPLSPTCIVDLRDAPRFGLIGDSKALAIHEALIRTSTADGRWMAISSGKEGVFVPVLSDKKLDSRAYLPYTPASIEAMTRSKIERVAIVTSVRTLFGYDSHKSLDKFPLNNNYPIVLEGLGKTIEELLRVGMSVVLVVDNPTLFDPKDCLNRQTSLSWLNRLLPNQNPEGCVVSLSKHLEYTKQYRLLLDTLAATYGKRVTIFDTTTYLCDESENICRPTKNGRLLYSYSDHISDYAGGVIGRDLNEYMRQR